jgi:serine/threonine-protein kinase
MSLSGGTRIGAYEILSLLGSGGMGEVYRARDTKLGRDVALKILPDAFATDLDRVSRFQREARVLASLNHPNIGHIYGLEDSGTPQALVLELVEGPTLADRIATGPLALDEALPIARQIAVALEVAHEHGVVHRDLKPANVKVRDDGTVKVLDFGLAKAFSQTPESTVDALDSPTLTARATQLGVVLGTAAYMSPEQAKGKVIDRRADIWAFGAVLYEMLSGRRAFDGEDVSDTLAAVLRHELDWSALRSDTPPGVRRLIGRCLDRDTRRRLRDIGEARIVLEDPGGDAVSSASTHLTGVAVPAARRPLWRRLLPIAATAVAVALVAGAAAWYLKPAPEPIVTRFRFSLPTGVTLTTLARNFVTISPDGTQIVFVANNRLYARSMWEADAHPVPGTEGPGILGVPVFSPDGRSIAYWSSTDSTIKRVSIEGGTVTTLCQADTPFGMSWAREGLVFAQGVRGTVMRVSPNGGTPDLIARVKPDELVNHPQILPGGRHLVFTVLSVPNTLGRWEGRVVVQALGSTEQRTILDRGTDARYLPTGHLAYAVGGVVFAAPFDASRAEFTGTGVAVLEGVRRSLPAATGAAQYAVSATGTLVYVPGPTAAAADIVDLGLSDRKGAVTPLNLPRGPYAYPRVSPDGRRIAFDVAKGQESFVAVYDLAGRTSMRRLLLGANSRFPVWTSDSRRVVYQSDREGDTGIFWQPADGTGGAERLTKPGPGETHVPDAWSPVSNTLLLSVVKGAGEQTLWALSLPDKTIAPFGGISSTIPINPVFSHDGRWIAYQTNQSGRSAIYVQPNPPTGSVHQLLAPPGDQPHEPLWSPDSKELFYNPRALGFEVVTVTTQPEFGFGNPVALQRSFQLSPPQARRSYDMTRGGLILAVTMPGAGDASAPQFEVVVNWFHELKQRLARQ